MCLRQRSRAEREIEQFIPFCTCPLHSRIFHSPSEARFIQKQISVKLSHNSLAESSGQDEALRHGSGFHVRKYLTTGQVEKETTALN